MMDLYHLSDSWVSGVFSMSNRGRIAHKPIGLWISDESQPERWSRFAREELDYLPRYRYRAEIDLGRVLHLASPLDVIRFDAAYAHLGQVNWDAVSREFSGILITPYQWDLRLSLNWYYGWDVASGCIWDATAIDIFPA